MDDRAIAPHRGTPVSAGMDLSALEPELIGPGKVSTISTGIGCKITEGHFGQIATRSSFALKGAVVLGVIDADYQGEIKIIMINLGAQPLTISQGERVAQMLLILVYLSQIEEGRAPTEFTVRGSKAFGSTNVTNVGEKV
ncbi:deoxyuridine 5'-triphosphate nucleotidohydrolase-like [Gastrophryne carolinensis]